MQQSTARMVDQSVSNLTENCILRKLREVGVDSCAPDMFKDPVGAEISGVLNGSPEQDSRVRRHALAESFSSPDKALPHIFMLAMGRH
jgi:hypothetical protein